jgi:hypothetical protein
MSAPRANELDDLIRWALAADLPSSKAIGRHAVGRVLVALVAYANRDGIAWPSTYTLEGDISGISRRDIRNALDLLEESGLIANVGKAGRSIRWKLSAGYPAQSDDAEPQEQAGEQAGEWAGQWAGTWAGEQAGTSAGYPAPISTGEELEHQPNSSDEPQATDSPAIEAELVEGDEMNSQILVDHFCRELENRGIKPQRKATWRAAAAALLDQDTPENIGTVITFALTDPFWAGKILTVPKLKEHYGQLKLRAQAEQRKSKSWKAAQAVAIGEAMDAMANGRFDPWEHQGPHDSSWGAKAIEQAKADRCNDCNRHGIPAEKLHRVKNGIGLICEDCIEMNGWEAA